jgi:hypothetical protein
MWVLSKPSGDVGVVVRLGTVDVNVEILASIFRVNVQIALPP